MDEDTRFSCQARHGAKHRLRSHHNQSQARLQQEHERSQHYLDAATRRPLVSEAEQQLVSAHLPTLLAQGSFAALVDAQVC